jgi:glycosyltransferase involved in cell wall biosynthesis
VQVLWVTAETPNRGLGGGSIRQSHLLERLGRALPTDVLVVGPDTDEHVRAAVRRVIETPALPPLKELSRTAIRVRGLRQALTSAGPAERLANAPARRVLAPLLDRALQETHYDVVIVEHAGLAPLLPRERHGRWLLTMHNVFSLTLEQTRDVAGSRRYAWLLGRGAATARKYEQWITASYDGVIAVSDEDAAALPPDSSPRVFVVPNGVDVRGFAATPVPTNADIVFVGTFDYLPNVDGAEWLCREVLPHIKKHSPDAAVTLVGRRPIPRVQQLTEIDGVTGAWDVPDTGTYVSAARVAVVPLRLGSGTRLKALEAMAVARPVVGTSLGLSGLHMVDGEHGLIADDPADFGACVAEVIADDRLADRLARGGRTHVEQQFSWDAIAEQLIAVVRKQAG